MSTVFMIVIAALYASAAVSFAFEGKFAWMLVALSWAVGNLVLGWMSR